MHTASATAAPVALVSLVMYVLGSSLAITEEKPIIRVKDVVLSAK